MWRLIDLICDFFAAASWEMAEWRVAVFIIVIYLSVLSVEAKYGHKWVTEVFSQDQSQERLLDRIERFRQSRY